MGTTTRILGVKRYEFNPSRFMGTLVFTLGSKGQKIIKPKYKYSSQCAGDDNDIMGSGCC